MKVYIAQVREANPKVQILFKEAYDARFMVGPEVALNLFRIVQEGIQNAIKHSEAAEIKVLIKTSDQKKIILTIADDGIGFEPNNSGEVGHGLRNMLFRANEIDLDFRIESKPGIGSTVFVQHKSA